MIKHKIIFSIITVLTTKHFNWNKYFTKRKLTEGSQVCYFMCQKQAATM